MNRRSFFARAFGFGAAVCMTHFLPIQMPKWKWGSAGIVVTSSGVEFNPHLTPEQKDRWMEALSKPGYDGIVDIWEDRA